MNLRILYHFCLFAILTAMGVGFCESRVMAAQEEQPGVDKGVDVLAHGPIHEAFAETLAFDPEPGIIVPKAPPDAIEEVPPEQKPEGDVEWIPGYWAWDDDRNDFIWVSGIWRVPPPGRQWIPGYWVKAEQGFQWISGYWTNIKVSETEYLPEPPESVEVGPNSSAPSPDYGWIPGCWLWYGGRYAWRPGYWAIMQPDWVWVPAHYVFTPRGYIFIGGYWDYGVIHRGVLFAPVFFGFGVTVRHGFHFTPSFIIDLHVFSDCLFLRPHYHHYYFGDYYAPRYYQRGFYPWFSLHARRHGYDPFYAHQRWEHRHDREWENHLNARFQERRENEKIRPLRMPKSAVELKKDKSPVAGRNVVVPFDHAAKIKDAPFRFQPLNDKDRSKFNQREKDVRTYRKERRDWEVQKMDKSTERTSKGHEPAKAKLPKSPITSKPLDQLDKKKVPPNRYKAPKPNPNVEPLQRKYDFSGTRSKEQKSMDRGRKSDNKGQKSHK